MKCCQPAVEEQQLEQIDALWPALKLGFSKIGIFLAATVVVVSGLTMPCETDRWQQCVTTKLNESDYEPCPR